MLIALFFVCMLCALLSINLEFLQYSSRDVGITGGFSNFVILSFAAQRLHKVALNSRRDVIIVLPISLCSFCSNEDSISIIKTVVIKKKLTLVGRLF